MFSYRFSDDTTPPALKLQLSEREAAELKRIAPNYVFSSEDDAEAELSIFGTPVLMPWAIEYQTQLFNRISLPHATVGTFERPKRIVITYVQGKDEPVYEYIAQDAWAIELQGVIVSEDGTYPLDRITQIERACNINTSLKLVNRICERLGISQVIITNRSFEPIEGSSNACSYSISLKSDAPFELEIDNDLNNLL